MPGHFTFYTSEIHKDLAHFGEAEFGHAIRTLRYRQGDAIEFTDGLGNMYHGNIEEIGKNNFDAIIKNQKTGEPKPLFSVAVGIIKSTERMEWMVEKCTELGVAGLRFVKTKQSERSHINIEKFRKTAIAAMKQSHRSWLPVVEEISWRELMRTTEMRMLAAIPGDTLPVQYKPQTGPHWLLIGPEGDFTPEETEEAITCGFSPVSLGPVVLRTETAVVAAAALSNLCR